STLNPFTQPVLQTRIFNSSSQQYPSTSKSLFSSEIQRPRDTQRILSPAEPILAPAQIPKPSLKVTEPTIQLPPPPPPPPVARRLSTNSIDVFADELYEQMIDPFIRETTYTIFDELISQWNNLTSQTVTIFNEF
ncbi:unnamed protein product, partial [Adineta steineri]